MSKIIFLIIFSFLFLSCDDTETIIYPDYDPSDFLSHTTPINPSIKTFMEGVYEILDGNGNFGVEAVVKWSEKYLSIFTERNAGFLVAEGGILDSIILFKGYWRHLQNTNHGTVEFVISSSNGTASLLNGEQPDSIIITGSYADGNNIPATKLVLRYSRPFSSRVTSEEFFLLSHRGGGRNSDLLGVSENTMGMIAKAEQFGAVGVELDVKISKDGVPFLYHDPDINLRLTQPGILHGQIEDFTFPQIRTFITLKNHETIPSLEEALSFIVSNTQLKTVWLDLKSEKDEIPAVLVVREKILRKSAALGRDINIFLGIPEDYKAEQLKKIPNYREIPTICELGPDKVRELNSMIWAPRWTEGLQTDRVLEMKAEGKKVFVWTLDEPDFIRKYMEEGEFDGVLSNFIPLVAFYHYKK
jgi:glycerophosphoryl diester phosphodiesterase